MIIAYMFALVLYLLPIFLFFGKQITKISFVKLSQKGDDFKDIKRIKVMVPIVFTIISFVIIIIINFFFSKKTLFDNNKKTDEFITVLTSFIFLGLLTGVSIF
jgi:hypothetical protein